MVETSAAAGARAMPDEPLPFDTTDLQVGLAEVPAVVWDAVVIGAGPAGSIAALTLARRGHRVLLLDRARFPRHKICGDALIPDALRCLDRHGLMAVVRSAGHEAQTLSVFSARRVRLDIPSQFVTIKRRTLDALLAREAVRAGVSFAQGRVSRYAARPDGSVTLAAESGGRAWALTARAAIVATGANVDLLREHGLVSRPGASAMALRCYVVSDERIDELVISYDRYIAPGYGWIFPMGGGEYNVGCGTVVPATGRGAMNLRRDFATFVESFPLARALMARARARTRLEGAMLRCGLEGAEPIGPGRSVAAGEAIGATFPLTGEGIGKAMETGVLAAESLGDALERDDHRGLAAFAERLTRDVAPKYVAYTRAERWLAWPRLGDFVLRRAQRSRYLQRAVAGILDETVEPDTVFSVRGVLRSCLE